MAKKKKEIVFAPKATKISTYIFHNTRFGIDLFVNCLGADGAKEQFDQCEFDKRGDWKIMMEIGEQPIGDKHE